MTKRDPICHCGVDRDFPTLPTISDADHARMTGQQRWERFLLEIAEAARIFNARMAAGIDVFEAAKNLPVPRMNRPSPAGPPDLQILVARHGRFDLITIEAWNEYDEGVAKWRAEHLVAVGVKPISPEQLQARKRTKRRAAKNSARPPGAGRILENASAPPKQEEQQKMDMSKYSGSSYLKPEHLAEGSRTETIADIRDGNYGRPELTFESGDCVSLNVTNTRILCRAWGPNSDDWVGKSIELSAGTTEYKGEKVPTIIIKPISPAVVKEAQQPLPELRDLRDGMSDEIPFALAFFIAGAVIWLAVTGGALIA